MFQSTHPHGVRHNLILCNHKFVLFQSTHPHGVRQRCNRALQGRQHVSIHAPTRGATVPPIHLDTSASVSIHAPTRGATTHLVYYQFMRYVSIHAPTRGATREVATGVKKLASFNPRTHTGCDETTLPKSQHSNVSIHAPTRGATKSFFPSLFGTPKFQSTHPHGVRPAAGLSRQQTETEFQSTHPHGVRRTKIYNIVKLVESFNPRTHTGCDLYH